MEKSRSNLPLLFVALFLVGVMLHSALLYLIGLGFLFSMPAVAILGLSATVLAIMAIFRDRGKFNVCVFAAAIGIWLAWIFLPAREIGILVRFELEKAGYEAAINDLNSGRTPACVSSAGCRIAWGSPNRIFFRWGGLGDAFGVVYDPSGSVATVIDYSIFGSEIEGCERIETSFYSCGLL